MLFSKIEIFISAMKILIHPKGRISYLMQKGVSIASFNINNALVNIIPDIKTIIDVGANIGQYALASHRFYPNSQIFSFEPVPICYRQLKENTKKNTNIHSYNYALGNQNSEIIFFQNDHTHASSALNVSRYQKEKVPKTKDFKEIKVKCFRLDDFPFEYSFLSPILLKLDVQGYERNVLEGASNFLQKVDYIVLETSFIPMYDNEPLFDEMHTHLKEKGFKLMAPIGALPDTNLAIPQLDMLYKRINSDS
jgi:FkbM family methyltransferase